MHSFNRNKITQCRSSTGILTLLVCLSIFASNASHATSDAPSIKSNENIKTIVVTLKPIYSLVAHLTKGISTPTLLSNNMQSPHHHNLRPSERRLIDKADMIIWLGAQMETYLTKIIQQQNSLNLSLIQTENLNLHNKRTKHTHNEEQHSFSVTNKTDPHIWLSPSNVKIISRRISKELITLDTKNAARYKKNLDKLLNKIENMDNEIRHILKNDKQPFVVAHDAFQYFEKEYKLNYIAAINSGDDTSVSAKHLTEVTSLIKKNNIHCLIYQPPKPHIIDALTRNKEIKAIALDPLGINLNNNNNYNSWFVIMEKLANNFHHCLSQ